MVETPESVMLSIKKVLCKKNKTPNNTMAVNKRRILITKSLETRNRISSMDLTSIGFKPS
jgi:hypothetical protein